MSADNKDYFSWPGVSERTAEMEDWFRRQEAKQKSERERIDLERRKQLAQMMAQYRVDQAPPPHPDTHRAEQLTKLVAAQRAELSGLMSAIQKDLKAIRASCTTCDCPADVPSTDCPNNKMANTMTALVAAAMSAVGG